jgi:hypothetical protein
MAFTAEQKRAHRAKPEVREREAAYKREWDHTNRTHKAEYQRAFRARQRPAAGALNSAGLSDTAPASASRTSAHDSAAKQLDLFKCTNN